MALARRAVIEPSGNASAAAMPKRNGVSDLSKGRDFARHI
jgi:hypothetical protein